MPKTYDPVTQMDEALERVASYLWLPRGGYSKEEIEALHCRPIPQKPKEKPKIVSACRGTRYQEGE